MAESVRSWDVGSELGEREEGGESTREDVVWLPACSTALSASLVRTSPLKAVPARW